ncbi:hypothetical protein EDD36DRAFT_466119 [Exophiala viscosa]|uniref:Uncharacterized protein n=1 Tax=Exophiala viscosa TaxID=2486360 RepID=A0AAN6DUC5_9EURO|nr:hypothetical protein EDD36DRAFT_466119 [Exophiala viscosa]
MSNPTSIQPVSNLAHRHVGKHHGSKAPLECTGSINFAAHGAAPPLPSSLPPKPPIGNPVDASKYLNRPNVAQLRGENPQFIRQQINLVQGRMKTQDNRRARLQAQLVAASAGQELTLIGRLMPMIQSVINMRDDVIGMYLLTGQNPQAALTTDHAARVLTLDANLSQLRIEQQRLQGQQASLSSTSSSPRMSLQELKGRLLGQVLALLQSFRAHKE